MHLEHVPLLAIQRELYRLPGGRDRFRVYLRTMLDERGGELVLPPLVAMNPMGKGHVADRLDHLLAIDAEGVAARAVAEAMTDAAIVAAPGSFKVGLVLADELGGGWTNRAAADFARRFAVAKRGRGWLAPVLWAGDPASTPDDVRVEVLETIHRAAYRAEHGPARTLRERLAQEGEVMRRAGAAGPILDPDDIEYTRAVIESELDSTLDRTAIECLFGDEEAATLGLTRRGLARRAGLALALADARRGRGKTG